MMTYQLLYDILRKEKYSEELQKLPENFLKEISEYIKEKREITERKHDSFEETIVATKKQLENFSSMLKELLARRQRKLLSFGIIAAETGITKRDFESMLEHEKALFEKIVSALEENKRNFFECIEGKKEKEEKNILVRFIEDVSAFMGMECEELGPYKIGQVANLPKEIAKILIDEKKAVAINKNI